MAGEVLIELGMMVPRRDGVKLAADISRADDDKRAQSEFWVWEIEH